MSERHTPRSNEPADQYLGTCLKWIYSGGGFVLASARCARDRFARTFSVLQRAAPQRSLLAPAVPISSARIGHTAGIDHDYTRIALGE